MMNEEEAIASTTVHKEIENENKTLAYLLIENPSKSNNLGTILRCAAAFAVQQVIFIGYDKCSVRGSHGSSKHVNIKSFFTIDRAIAYLRDECGVASFIGLLGDANVNLVSCDENAESVDKSHEGAAGVLEDGELKVVKPTTRTKTDNSPSTPNPQLFTYPSSYPVHTRPFPTNGNVCFSISKKSIGLPIAQARHCDSFVHIQTAIPTTSSATTPMHGLLDAPTCLSITLHHYNEFAKHGERDFNGQKFDVAHNTQKGRMDFDENGEDVRRRRLEMKLKLQNERDMMEMGNVSIANNSDEKEEGVDSSMVSLFS